MMDFYEYEELLEEENRQNLQHHGILGQKKGVRNGPPYPIPKGEHSAEEKRKNPGIDKNAPDAPKKRHVKDLSNQELRDKTERLRLENEFTRQSYEQIRLAQGPQIQQGKSFLQKAADLSKNVNTIAVNTNSILRVFTGKDIATMLGNKAGVDVNKAKEAAKSDAVQKLKDDIMKDLNKSVKKETEKRAKKETTSEEKNGKEYSDEKKSGRYPWGSGKDLKKTQTEDTAKGKNGKGYTDEEKSGRYPWGSGKESKEAKKEAGANKSESKSEERSYWDASDARRKPSYDSDLKTETYKQTGRDEYKFTEKSPLSEAGSSFIGQLVDTGSNYASYVSDHEVRVDLDSAEDWLKRIGAY